MRTQILLTIQQERKCLSNQSLFSSLVVPNSHRPAGSHGIIRPQQQKPWRCGENRLLPLTMSAGPTKSLNCWRLFCWGLFPKTVKALVFNHPYCCSCCCGRLRLCRWALLGPFDHLGCFPVFLWEVEVGLHLSSVWERLGSRQQRKIIDSHLQSSVSQQQLHTTQACTHKRDGCSTVTAEFSPLKYYSKTPFHFTWTICLAPFSFAFMAGSLLLSLLAGRWFIMKSDGATGRSDWWTVFLETLVHVVDCFS